MFSKNSYGLMKGAMISTAIGFLVPGSPTSHGAWVAAFAKRLSMIFFALFFLGFLALLGFAYLVGSALTHAELVPALVMISV